MAPTHTTMSTPDFKRYLKDIKPLKKGFDVLNDHVIITDANAHILYANAATEQQTGFSVEEMLGKNPADLYGGHMPRDFYENMWRQIKTDKKPFVGTVKNKRKDGTIYWQDLHITPVLDARGDVKLFIGIEPNVTERKQKEIIHDEFVSIMGHQLREPATVIRWMLESLLDTGIQKKQRKKLMDIYAKIGSLLALVGDLLELSYIEKAQNNNTELCDLAEEINMIIQKIAGYRNMPIMFNKDAGRYDINVNKTFLQQFFRNIIMNAVDYADAKKPTVLVTLARDKGAYVFSCKDNGIGIPTDEQEKIFTRFFRASNARERKEAGSGLGLFIVKLIADHFQWGVSFESAEGKGTTFFVKIPFL